MSGDQREFFLGKNTQQAITLTFEGGLCTPNDVVCIRIERLLFSNALADEFLARHGELFGHIRWDPRPTRTQFKQPWGIVVAGIEGIFLSYIGFAGPVGSSSSGAIGRTFCGTNFRNEAAAERRWRTATGHSFSSCAFRFKPTGGIMCQSSGKNV